jgi:hypothetical protein
VVDLNDINTVNNVKMKPVIVNEIVERSEATEYICSSFGNNLLQMVKTDIEAAIVHENK